MTTKTTMPVTAILLYRVALFVGFAASALTMAALLNFRVLHAVFSHWAGIWVLLILANPFIAILLRHTILLDDNRPHKLLLLGCTVFAIPTGYLAFSLAG